jgi:hypothetical protein
VLPPEMLCPEKGGSAETFEGIVVFLYLCFRISVFSYPQGYSLLKPKMAKSEDFPGGGLPGT